MERKNCLRTTQQSKQRPRTPISPSFTACHITAVCALCIAIFHYSVLVARRVVQRGFSLQDDDGDDDAGGKPDELGHQMQLQRPPENLVCCRRHSYAVVGDKCHNPSNPPLFSRSCSARADITTTAPSLTRATSMVRIAGPSTLPLWAQSRAHCTSMYICDLLICDLLLWLPVFSQVNARFWQMVWEQNVELVVMVTNEFDGDRRKAMRYWPTSAPIVRVKCGVLLICFQHASSGDGGHSRRA